MSSVFIDKQLIDEETICKMFRTFAGTRTGKGQDYFRTSPNNILVVTRLHLSYDTDKDQRSWEGAQYPVKSGEGYYGLARSHCELTACN